MPLSREIDFGPGDIVLNGNPAALPKQHIPQFSAHVCCAQTAAWTKIPLGAEVGLDYGHIVLDGDPASPQWGTAAPSFRPMSIVATIDMGRKV